MGRGSEDQIWMLTHVGPLDGAQATTGPSYGILLGCLEGTRDSRDHPQLYSALWLPQGGRRRRNLTQISCTGITGCGWSSWAKGGQEEFSVC